MKAEWLKQHPEDDVRASEWLKQHLEDEVRALFMWQYIRASNSNLIHGCHDAIFAGKGNG